MGGLTAAQTSVLAILAVAFLLLVSEKLRHDLVGVLVVLALSATGVLTPEQALAGFSSEPAIVLATMLILSGGLQQSGVSGLIGERMGRWARGGVNGVLAVMMPSVALLSAFTHHVTTTAAMLPVTLKLAEDRKIPPSKLLMPLSFAASLGTTLTIVGAPAFLIANQVLRENGRPGLGVFSITPIGLALTTAGTLFVLLVARFLLPERPRPQDPTRAAGAREYLTELTILDDSPFLGKTLEQVGSDGRYQFDLVGWVRAGRRMRPRGVEPLREGDVLIIQTSQDEIATIRAEKGVELHPVKQYEEELKTPQSGEVADVLVQAVVASDSDLVGRTIADIDFKGTYGVIVVALLRRRVRLWQELSWIPLQEGDVLVLLGAADAIARIEKDRSFLMLVPFHGEPTSRRKAPLAAAIMVGAVALAVSGLASLPIATLAGAAAMVLTGCLTARQAYRAIDLRIFVFIAGVIPLGTAMKVSGTAELLAGGLEHALEGWNEVAVLLALFAIVAVITQFMSDAGTTALFAPVAVALAAGLGHPPEAFVVTVAMASVAAFLTPIGHHGNLLVYGPGGYRFLDFVILGTPLTVVAALLVSFLAAAMWG